MAWRDRDSRSYRCEPGRSGPTQVGERSGRGDQANQRMAPTRFGLHDHTLVGGARMTKLAELARLIRSKNAGPFELTFDIMFEDDARYRRVQRSGALTREAVAERYGLEPSQVKFFYCD